MQTTGQSKYRSVKRFVSSRFPR